VYLAPTQTLSTNPQARSVQFDTSDLVCGVKPTGGWSVRRHDHRQTLIFLGLLVLFVDVLKYNKIGVLTIKRNISLDAIETV